MHDLPLIAGLQAFWQTVTAASADICQLHAAAAEGLDTAVAGGEALDLPGGAGGYTAGWGRYGHTGVAGMTTIAIANQKGGVGKTTLAVHLAAYLAEQGRSVALVDCDPQGNASSWLLGGDTTQDGLFQLLVVGRPAVTLTRAVPGWGCRLLPGNHRSGEGYIFLAATGKPFDAVAQMLRPLAAEVDYLLLDTMPSKGAGYRETLFAADWVLAPTQVERLSLEGVAFMARTCQELTRERGRGPRLLGIIPNMTRRQTGEHQAQMAELVATFGPTVWPPIPLSVRVAEACAYGTTVFAHAPEAPVTAALRLVGQRLIANLEG